MKSLRLFALGLLLCLLGAGPTGCAHRPLDPVRYQVRHLGTRHILPTGQPLCLWGYRISKEETPLPPNARIGLLVPRRAVRPEVENRRIDYWVDENPVGPPFRTGRYPDHVVVWRETGPEPDLRSLQPHYLDIWFFGPIDYHTGTIGVVVDLERGPHVEWTQVLEVTSVQPVNR